MSSPRPCGYLEPWQGSVFLPRGQASPPHSPSGSPWALSSPDTSTLGLAQKPRAQPEMQSLEKGHQAQGKRDGKP